MKYQIKYLKYKNKYLTLKNQIGGNIKSRNYYLHIRFSKDFEEKIRMVKNNLVDYDIIKETMAAHITISYGPKIEYDDMIDPSSYEIKDVIEIEQIYPNFFSTFEDKIPTIKYTGVSAFLRNENIVIKMDIESDILLEMIKYCRLNIMSYNETVKELKSSYNQSKEDLKKRFPILFKEEHSFDEDPIGALHITLITIKSDTLESDIIDIITLAELELSRMGINKGDTIVANRIDVKTPITKRFIDLHIYKTPS